MRYEVSHVTVYEYDDSVSVSHHVARLRPQVTARQRLIRHDWQIDPAPAVLTEHTDYFGNAVAFFAVQGPHHRLTVTSRSLVDLLPPPPVPERSPPWEEIREHAPDHDGSVFEFVVDSPLAASSAEYAAYAAPSFPAGRPIVDAVIDLTARIHRDLRFDRGATSVTTPVAEVFRRRSGVCQDFSHLQIACLRSLGLPARYVSGYLETAPPPNAPRLVGVDASHAWVAVYVTGHGWIDVDPTNDLVPAGRHITLGWGRDYSDVSPIRGVILGGGDHRSRVAVDVVPQGPLES